MRAGPVWEGRGVGVAGARAVAGQDRIMLADYEADTAAQDRTQQYAHDEGEHSLATSHYHCWESSLRLSRCEANGNEEIAFRFEQVTRKSENGLLGLLSIGRGDVVGQNAALTTRNMEHARRLSLTSIPSKREKSGRRALLS